LKSPNNKAVAMKETEADIRALPLLQPRNRIIDECHSKLGRRSL
jgi:hypothetical protein